MKRNEGRYAVKKMAALLKISRAAYYKWRKYGRDERGAEAEKEIVKAITAIQKENKNRYGAPRIQREPRKQMMRVTRKRIAKLLREYGLNARNTKRFIQTTNSAHGFPVCENILNRDFFAERPGLNRVSDITYIFTKTGWRYLTTVIDLYDRKVIGWAVSDNMETVHTTEKAPEMARINRTPEKGLIFHSDRGVQYCAAGFRNLLVRLCPGVRQSMSRKGDCWDNACAEAFFKTLKRELETPDGKHTAEEVGASIFEYIEVYYNGKRLHSSLDYLTPNEQTMNYAA
jgi:transposase InsO family protein